MWITILIVLLLILCWLAFAPFEFQIDTRALQASLGWMGIGRAMIVYESEKWMVKIKVLFFKKQWELEKIIFREKTKKRLKKISRQKSSRKRRMLDTIFNIAKTLKVTKWQIAIDTGDVLMNAWLCSLNFYPPVHRHLLINFSNENYLLLVVRNTPWKLVRTFMR